VEHFRPLIPHEADNGFPSDHALLAAGIVAAVGFARLLWVLPFGLLAGLVDWARVGVGVHHPIDVLGSDAFVLLGVVVALVVAAAITARVLPYVPGRLLDLVAEPDRQVA
jgi:undecaprenyl-diphosphatase